METKKTTPVWAWIVLTAFIILIGMIIWGSTMEDEPTISTKSTPATVSTAPAIISDTRDKLGTQYRTTFITSCNEGYETNAEQLAYCECTYDFMDGKYTNAKFEELMLEYYGGDTDISYVPAFLKEATEACF